VEPNAISPPSRRFNLGDGLVLIAVAAFTLAMLRASDWFERMPDRLGFWLDTFSGIVSSPPRYALWGPRTGMALVDVLEELLQLLFPLLAGLTVAQPVMRLRRPRPPRGDLIWQAGFVSCLAVILGTLILVDLSWAARDSATQAMMLVPIALLLWPALGLRPWRAEASWIDRLGRGVGWGWLALGGIATVLNGM
jgi:hypothetical protein